METTYKYAYEKLMAENNISLTELPEDAKTGIASLKNIELAISMAQKKAAKNNKTFVPSAATNAKIKAYDKWVTGEIVDYLDEKDTNPDAPKDDAVDIVDAVAADAKAAEEAAAAKNEKVDIDFTKGDAIDQELKVFYETNKRLLNINDIRDAAPKTYTEIHATYKVGEENGVVTNNFLLKETATANDFELTIVK